MEPSPRRAAQARSQSVPPMPAHATAPPPPPTPAPGAGVDAVSVRHVDGSWSAHRRTDPAAAPARKTPVVSSGPVGPIAAPISAPTSTTPTSTASAPAGGNGMAASDESSPATRGDERDMPPGVPATWRLPDVALPRLLADAVKDFPEHLAVAERGGTHLTHVELAGLVDRLAIALQHRGVARLVLVDAGPIAATLVAHAAWRLGIPLVTGLDAAPPVGGDEGARPAVTEFHPATDAYLDPGTGPATDPAVAPATDPAVAPATDPGVDPATDPGVAPATDPRGDAAGGGAATPVDVDGEVPAHGIRARLADWDPARDVAVGTRRHLGDLGVPAVAMLVDDLGRLGATGEGRAARLGRAFRRGRRLLRRVGHRDRSSLASTLEDTSQGVLPAVPPDAVALVHVTSTGRHVFTHRALVAAVFQVRLWIPDMAAGTERVAVAMPLDTPVAFVVGPLLAILAAGTLRCDRDPATTIAGATIAFGSVAAWHDVARRGRRRHRRPLARSDGGPSSLRIGGVVSTAADDMLAASEVRTIVAHTEGARLRHFWVAPAAAGPVAAQPVYGRVLGTPGAEALTDTLVAVVDGVTVAAGPQFADGPQPADATQAAHGTHVADGPHLADGRRPARAALPAGRAWHDVHGHVPAPPSAVPRKDAP